MTLREDSEDRQMEVEYFRRVPVIAWHGIWADEGMAVKQPFRLRETESRLTLYDAANTLARMRTRVGLPIHFGLLAN